VNKIKKHRERWNEKKLNISIIFSPENSFFFEKIYQEQYALPTTLSYYQSILDIRCHGTCSLACEANSSLLMQRKKTNVASKRNQ
jgi:hypothetical protein